MQDILHIFRCYFVQQITFFSKLRLIENFAQLASFLLHFLILTQQLYLSEVDVFERSFENLKFLVQILKTILKKICYLNLPINLLSIQVFGAGNSSQLQLQSKSVTPSASTQYIYPSSRYDGLSQVIVNGDSNLVSGNIKSRTSIFGVNGNYSPLLKSKTITPSATEQTIYTSSSGYDGFSSVTVKGDSNLISSNIKNEVSIFGVTGSLSPRITKITSDVASVSSGSIIFTFESLPTSVNIYSIEAFSLFARLKNNDDRYMANITSYYDTNWKLFVMLTKDGGGFETATLNSVSNHELIFILDNPPFFQ